MNSFITNGPTYRELLKVCDKVNIDPDRFKLAYQDDSFKEIEVENVNHLNFNIRFKLVDNVSDIHIYLSAVSIQYNIEVLPNYINKIKLYDFIEE